jgi:N-acetylglutamate synthase-like GNAT family acetyltransferase
LGEIIELSFDDLDKLKFLWQELYPEDNVYESNLNRMRAVLAKAGSKLFGFKVAGQIVAHVALIDNPLIHFKDYRVNCLGFYECVQDQQIALELLSNIRNKAKSAGADYLIGPMDGSTWNAYRFTLPSENPRVFLEPYHKPYYPAQFESFGFSTLSHYVTDIFYEIPIDKRLDKVRKRLADQQVEYRPISIDSFEKELQRLYPMNLNAFKDNFLYSPIGYEEFYQLFKGLPLVLDEDLSVIATRNGEVVGFLIAIADRFDLAKRTVMIKTIAVLPEKLLSGLGYVMTEDMHVKARKKGFTKILHALMQSENTSANSYKNEQKEYKRYILYGKEI